MMPSKDALASYTQISVSDLHLVCKTTWRGMKRVGGPYERSYPVSTVERRHDEQQIFSLTYTEPRIASEHPHDGIKFSFAAGRRSHLAPSFGSFLIANSYDLRANLHVDTYGYHKSFSFEVHHIPIVSSIQAPITGIRQLQFAAERRHSSQI